MARWRRLAGHLRPRRFQVFNVGNAKTGTTTVPRMFDAYRSSHECDAQLMRPLAAAVLRGELAPDAPRVRRAFRRRSLRFHLEVDAANFLTPFVGMLTELYSDAKFVLTIRDCFTWLDSRVEQLLHQPPATEGYTSAQYERFDEEFAPEELALRDAGLRPVAVYLRGWADYNQRVLASVPPDRLLVVRTEDLDGSSDLLARFAGVPASTVRSVHANRNEARSGFLGHVPAAFIVERAREHCGALMERYWDSEWYDLSARLPVAPADSAG
jgi:hypothetical protein